jgi:hypothetical protein
MKFDEILGGLLRVPGLYFGPGVEFRGDARGTGLTW